MTHILVVASTFPASDTDPVPAFVKDQVIAMKSVDASLQFSVLAPHDVRSFTKDYVSHAAYDEYRFHYILPHSLEKLAGRGIMPTLKANPLYYLLIPPLFICEAVALYVLVRKLRPDMLYAHWFTPQAVITRIIGALTSTPFVFTTHASDVSVWHKIPLIGTHVVRWSTRSARAFTAVSQRSMEKLAVFFDDTEWATLQQRAKIIPMGVDVPTDTTPTDVTNSHVLFVGRLAEKKGVQYLLPAFKQFVQDFPEATLTIAGDGPWLALLQKQATTLALSDKQLTFAGYVTGDSKRELINSHSVYIVPSIITDDGDAEGLPVSLMEGLASGKLCIATNESGADGILTNARDGFLITQKDTGAITHALKKALSLSPSDKQAMSDSARVTAKQFSWPVVAKQHIEFLIKDPS